MGQDADKSTKRVASKANPSTAKAGAKTTKAAGKTTKAAGSTARAAKPAPRGSKPRPAAPAPALLNPHVRSVTACLVARDDARSIADVIEGVEKALADAGVEAEIIVVNDGSTDDTETVLNGLQAERTSLRVITNRTTRGYGAALRAAMGAAGQDWIITTTADGRYDTGAIGRLIDVARDDVDVVQGYATGRHPGRAAAALVTGVEAAGIGCELRLVRRDVLSGLALQADTEAVGIELARALDRRGARTVYVGVSVASPSAPADLGVRAQRAWSVVRDLARVARSARATH